MGESTFEVSMIEYSGQTRADYPYFLPVSLRISDIDVNDHLNQSVYYEFFDTAVLRFLAQLKDGHSIDPNITTFCVENGCRYRREVKFADVAGVALRVTRVGNTSVQFELALFTEGHDDPNALAFFVLVFANKISRRPVPIPDVLRDHL